MPDDDFNTPHNDRLDFVDARLPRYDRCDKCGQKAIQRELYSIMVAIGDYELWCDTCLRANPYGPE